VKVRLGKGQVYFLSGPKRMAAAHARCFWGGTRGAWRGKPFVVVTGCNPFGFRVCSSGKGVVLAGWRYFLFSFVSLAAKMMRMQEFAACSAQCAVCRAGQAARGFPVEAVEWIWVRVLVWGGR